MVHNEGLYLIVIRRKDVHVSIANGERQPKHPSFWNFTFIGYVVKSFVSFCII